MHQLRPYLLLARPANTITAVADVLAGMAIAGFFTHRSVTTAFADIAYLVIATMLLYAGGIIFNDVFDIEIDRKERPERPLPSGAVSLQSAVLLGSGALLLGIFFAFGVGWQSGLIGMAIAAMALIYDRFAKPKAFWGPLVMGTCRGLNLLLGISILPLASTGYLCWISLLPVVFIFAVTLTSRGEVTGGNRGSIRIALGLDLLIIAILLALGWSGVMNLWWAMPFLLLWAAMNIIAKFRAIRHNEPHLIMKAVKTGVISLIPLDATYAAGFSGWKTGLLVLLLLPLAHWLSGKFAVT